MHPETQLDLFSLFRRRGFLRFFRRRGRGWPTTRYQAENEQHDQPTEQ
jgi:hypothetical protein